MQKHHILILIIVVGCGIAAIDRWRSAPLPSVTQGELVIDPKHLDFGEVWETDQFEWTMPVQNRSDASVRVSSFNSSCGDCASPTSTTSIPADGMGNVKFKLDLCNPCAIAEPQAIREAKIKVFLRTDTTPSIAPIPAELHGFVKSAIIVPTRSIDFGRFPATANQKSRVVPIRALRELRDLTASVNTSFVEAEIKPTGAGKWELHVRPRQTTLPSRYETTVRLSPVTAEGEVVPSIAIRVAYDVLHDIQADTPLVSLGSGRIGETLSGTLTISSLSGRPFALPTCDGKDVLARRDMLVVSPSAPAPKSSYTFTFSHKVTEREDCTARVFIRGNDAEGKPFELRVDVQWYGQEA